MLISEKNQNGIISVNGLAVNQIIAESIKPEKKNIILLSEKRAEYTDKGLYLALHISLRFGESISSVCSGISRRIAKYVEDMLEVKVHEIDIYIDEIRTSKAKVKKDLVYHHSTQAVTELTGDNTGND